MALIIQISDTHFGTDQAPVVEALVRLVHEQTPDLVIMSGDITQRAHASQFAAARLFLNRLKVPAALVIPGNHDIPLFNLAARIFWPYANFQRAFGNNLEPVYESEALLVITVKTTRRYRHIDGEISQLQIDRVASLLQKAKQNQLRIVVTHQPVCVIKPEDDVNLLHGHDAAIRSWSSAGANVIMGGHIHLPYVRPLHECYTGLTHQIWAVQAGTAVSSRIRHDAGNSVNFIRYDPTQTNIFTVERWDYLPQNQCFDTIATHELKRDTTGYAN